MPVKRIVLTLLCLCLVALGQQRTEQRAPALQHPARPNTGHPKRPSELQQRAYDLLQTAESTAAGLQPGMRAFALLEIAHGYERSNEKKAVKLLDTALVATRAVEDDDLQTRQQLQREIMHQFVMLAPNKADEHLLQVDSAVREAALEELLSYYKKQNNLDRAMQVVYRLGAEQEIPYGAVTKLIEMLAPQQNAEVQQLFAVSLSSYREHKHQGFAHGDGFPELIVKTWKRVPASLAEDAINEVLSQADPANNSDPNAQKMSISIASKKGAVAFNSAYQWRLFQFIPVLRQLDPEEADELIKKSQEVQTLLDRYPQGTGSLEGKDGESRTSMFLSLDRNNMPPGAPSPLEMQRAEEIMADADKHPAEALANAEIISNMRLRTDVLGSIAHSTAKKDPQIARSALKKTMDATAQMDDPNLEVMTLRGAADVYLQMGDEENAKKVVQLGLAAAEKLFQEDGGGDDPNGALKAYWPSVQAYRSLLQLAARISPGWAISVLNELPDDDVKVVVETALAAAWLGLPPGQVLIMSSTKNGKNMIMQEVSK